MQIINIWSLYEDELPSTLDIDPYPDYTRKAYEWSCGEKHGYMFFYPERQQAELFVEESVVWVNAYDAYEGVTQYLDGAHL